MLESHFTDENIEVTDTDSNPGGPELVPPGPVLAHCPPLLSLVLAKRLLGSELPDGEPQGFWGNQVISPPSPKPGRQ